ncbi:MAG: penicillin-binding transpeptidase domain-containing protein, partial [Flavobacteriales bacterium]
SSPESLKIEEAATIVGMLKNPSYFNPKRFTERTQGRRNVVLAQMEKYKFITPAERDSLSAIPLDMSKFKAEDHNTGPGAYFREFIRDELMRWCATHTKPDGTKYNLYKDGLKIYTTIDSRMQEHAEAAVKEHMKVLQKDFFDHWKGRKNAPFAFITEDKIDEIMRQSMKRSDRYRSLKEAGMNQKEIDENFRSPVEMTLFTWNGDSTVTMTPWDSIRYYKHFLRTALMAVDPTTGFIKAWVGGINHKYFKYDQVYTGKRQVGSTFKPFVYAVAMREGLSPCTEVPNITVCIETPSGPWCPDNSSKAFEGSMVSLKDALANSINKVSALLIKQYGVKPVIDLAQKLGITSKLDPVPSICLGTADISLYEMVGANAAFVNQGVYRQPTYITRIEDKNGNLLQEFAPKTVEALDEQTAFLTVELMKGVVEGGTAARLRGRYKLTYPIAGKTGTTQNNSDGWFMGLTPELVTGVWVGCEDRSAHFRSTALGQGANTALPIWGIFMQKVYADQKINLYKGDFKVPDKLTVEIDCAKYRQEKRGSQINFDNIDIFQ